MTTAAINRQVIQRMLAALPQSRTKSAAQGTMEDPGYQGGESSAPSAQPQAGTCDCPEGDRAADHSRDLRDISSRWLPGVDKPEPEKADDDTIPSMGDATKRTPTGEDPASEEDSTRKSMSDPGYQGGETTAPSRYEEKAAMLARLQNLRKSGAALLTKLAAQVGYQLQESGLPYSLDKAAESQLDQNAMLLGQTLAEQAMAAAEDPLVKNAVAVDTLQAILRDAELGAVKTAAYLYGLIALDELQSAQLKQAAAELEKSVGEESGKEEAEEEAEEESAEESDSASADESAESPLTPEEEALLDLLTRVDSGGVPGGSVILPEILGEVPPEDEAAMLDSALSSANVSPEDLQQALAGKMASLSAQLASGATTAGDLKTLQVMSKMASALPSVQQRRLQRQAPWRPKTAREQQIRQAMSQFVTELVRRSH